ncbi:MAG TPA: ArgR family transcriptional regulator [Actinomycetota bacterium]|nr:ArgR family transcriptional regulator [Actinomycetota bacterium]
MTGSKTERQQRIARLLAEGGVSSQGELVGLLASAGQVATQATVSRDLEELGAVKVRRHGRVVYALPGSPAIVAPPGDGALRRLPPGLVSEMEAAGNLVVVHTPPGCAGMVAAVIDGGSLDGVAGTVAGDDTILVVCRQGTPVSAVEATLRLLAEGSPQSGTDRERHGGR